MSSPLLFIVPKLKLMDRFSSDLEVLQVCLFGTKRRTILVIMTHVDCIGVDHNRLRRLLFLIRRIIEDRSFYVDKTSKQRKN